MTEAATAVEVAPVRKPPRSRALATADAQPPEVSMFERLARDPTVSVEKLERLVALKQKMDADHAKAAFYAAFATMQGEIPVIDKGGKILVNGQVRSTYSRAEDIDRIIKPILQKHGFSLLHKREMAGQTLTVRTTLAHSAGHTEETSFTAAADSSGSKNAIQAWGSSDAYGRRYNTIALLNIATGDVDDDGAGTNTGATITEDQAATVQAKLEEVPGDRARNLAQFLRHMKVGSIAEIPAKAYDDAITAIEATIRNRTAGK